MKGYKYLVIEEQGYDDDILTIVDTRADAQEFILSCLETEIYENFYYLVFGEHPSFKDVNQYFESVREDFEDLNYETYYGYLLDEPLTAYRIEKVPYLEG